MENKGQLGYEQSVNASSAKGSVPFEVVESYKNIRTNLMYMLSQTNKKSVVISSSTPAEGKSTTAVNIAIAFSQLGDKVLLLDADMRLPSIHKKMKLPNSVGFSSVLAGFDKLEDAIIHINNNLDVICSGPLPPNPLEHLSSQKATNLILELESKYDYIIIDTPPIGVVTDPLVVARNTAGIILVVRDNITKYDYLDKSISQANLINAKILGVVLNGVEKNNKQYGYKYYGGYSKLNNR